MAQRNIVDRVLESLASDRRTIVADWRFHIAMVRVARAYGEAVPNAEKATQLIRRLQRSDKIESIEGVSGVYRIIVPFASSLPAPDEVILLESNPLAVLAFSSAIVFHGLTVELPSSLYALVADTSSSRLPLGTTSEDWTDVPRARLRSPGQIESRAVNWTNVKSAWDFGVSVGYIQGLPVFVTDLEKTLVDALRFPEKCGGEAVVIEAWQHAEGQIDTERLVKHVEAYNQRILSQRVGFMAEQVGLNHHRFDDWVENATRGSSAKLMANLPFDSSYSPRWSLSINVPAEWLPRPEEISQ